MSHAYHHQHKRKRIHEKKESYPHPNAMKRFLDHFVYVVGIASPLIASTQAYKIWEIKDATSIAIESFAFALFANIVLLIYGIVHKEKILIAMYICWALVNGAIVFGTFLYG